jgi:hypothetical protein
MRQCSSGRSSSAPTSSSPSAGDEGDVEHLPAQLRLRKGLRHPDLSALLDADAGITLEDAADAEVLRIPGRLPPGRAAEIDNAIGQGRHVVGHLRCQRLGEFTVGTDLHRSESLALVQLLLVSQLVMVKAAVARGGVDASSPRTKAEAENENVWTESTREGLSSPAPAESDEEESEAAWK